MNTLGDEKSNRIAAVVRQTLAYAAGITEADITDNTGMLELGIDSVAMMASKVVLEAELEIQMSDKDLVKLFDAGTVGEAIILAGEIAARGYLACSVGPS